MDAYRGVLDGESLAAIEGQVVGLGLVQAAVIVALFMIVPMLRSDRATPGVASVDLAVVRAGRPGEGAAAWSVVLRALIRFGPVPVVGPAWFAFGARMCGE